MLALFVIAGALFASCSTPGNGKKPEKKPEKPAPAKVEFSHKIHNEGQDLSCQDCHAAAWKAEEAGFPKMETCEGCHMEPDPGTAVDRLFTELLSRAKAGQPIWGDRHEPEMDFHHGTHAPTQKLTNKKGEQVRLMCTHCHADVAGSDKLPADTTPERKLCLQCHD
jgi:hypothetical protein